MKKIVLMTASLSLLGSLAIGTTVFAEDGGERVTNGVIKFKTDTSPTDPIDPTNPDPEHPVVPIDPIDPEKPVEPGTNGPLSIDYASQFQFGEQMISTKDQIYFADIQSFAGGTTGPNYIQVTDKRGSLEGWSLSVKQNGQFATADQKELTGAVLTLNNGNVTSNLLIGEGADPTVTPATVASKVVLNVEGEEHTIVTANEEQGMGTWIYRLGNNAEQGKDSVKLEIPGKTTKRATEYTTTMTWTLKATPE